MGEVHGTVSARRSGSIALHSMDGGSVSVVFARGILAQARALGLPVAALVDRLPASEEEDGDARLSLEQVRETWRRPMPSWRRCSPADVT